MILATGVAYRQLAAPGLDELTGRGVFYGVRARPRRSAARSGRLHRGRRQLGGTGGGLPLPRGKSVTILLRGRSMEQVDVVLPHPADRRRHREITVRTCTEVVAAHGTDHLERLTLLDTATGETGTVDAQWLFVFIGAAPRTDWLDGVVVRDDRGFVVAGPDLAVEGQIPRGWDAGPRPLPPRDQRPRSIRRRRRPRRVGQAGGLRRRRRGDGRHARAPLPGEAMTDAGCAAATATPTNCVSLFLFEKLDPDQLAWLCDHGRVGSPPGTVYAEGDPATCFYVLLDGTVVLSAGWAPTTSRSTAPPSGGLRRSLPGLPRRPVPPGVQQLAAGAVHRRGSSYSDADESSRR